MDTLGLILLGVFLIPLVFALSILLIWSFLMALMWLIDQF